MNEKWFVFQIITSFKTFDYILPQCMCKSQQDANITQPELNLKWDFKTASVQSS